MAKNLSQLIKGYQRFKNKYSKGDPSLMEYLEQFGQNPDTMVVACSDSRVDPAILLQCDPGDLFVVRNIANIVPPCENDERHHGTSAALEFGICHLNVKDLIILGHSNCAGVNVKVNDINLKPGIFIKSWVSQIEKCPDSSENDLEPHCKKSLLASYENCLSFSWIKERLENNLLNIHLWYLDINNATIYSYNHETKDFIELNNY